MQRKLLGVPSTFGRHCSFDIYEPITPSMNRRSKGDQSTLFIKFNWFSLFSMIVIGRAAKSIGTWELDSQKVFWLGGKFSEKLDKNSCVCNKKVDTNVNLLC